MPTPKLTKSMSKRKTPIFRISVKDKTQLEQIYNHPQIKSIVIEELVFAIKDGLNRNRKSISLFQVGDSEFELELNKADWKKSLNTALNFYIKKEDYVKCIEIRNMINQLN